MSEAVELTLEDLFSRTTEDLFQKAAEEDRLPTGKYITKISRSKIVKNGPDDEYNPDREIVLLSLDFYAEDGKTKVGSKLQGVSWEPRYTASDRLDGASKRYVELARLSGAEDVNNPGQVLSALGKMAFMTRIRETFIVEPDDLHATHLERDPNDSGQVWITLRPEEVEEHAHYVSFGYTPKALVDRFFPIKD